MGDARKRKIAKAAGKPWAEDAPPPPRQPPRYMTKIGMSPMYPIAMAGPPPSEGPSVAEQMREVVQRDNARVLVIGDDPRGLPARRRSGMELALLMTALSLDGPLIVKPPKR